MALSSKVILTMEERELDVVMQKPVKQLSQIPQAVYEGVSSGLLETFRSCEMCSHRAWRGHLLGQSTEGQIRNHPHQLPFQNWYRCKTVFSTKQPKQKGETFVALSSAKDGEEADAVSGLRGAAPFCSLKRTARKT